MSSVTFNWYTLLGALAVAAAAAVFAFYRYIQEQKHQRSTLLNSLFAEIANIYEHYTYAAHELPAGPDDQFELQKRLRWSVYGDINSVGDVGKLGFLSAENIKALLQLSMLVRNDDLLSQQLLGNLEFASEERLKYLKGRFKGRMRDSENFICELIKDHPRLGPIFEKMKENLP